MWWRLSLRAVAFGCLAFFVSNYQSALSAEALDLMKATHKQVRVIRPVLDGQDWHLNTFAMSPEGQLWMCCSTRNPSMVVIEHNDKEAVAQPSGKILIYDAEGTFQRAIDIPLVPQALNFSPAGIPFVAGSGKIARLLSIGEIDLVVDAPNLDASPEMKEKRKQQMEKILAQSLEARKSSLRTIEKQIETLEKQLVKDESDADQRQMVRTENRIEFLKKQLKQQTDSVDQYKEQIEQAIVSQGSIEQLKKATGLAVTRDNVFASLPSPNGNGYAIYRLTHDLTEPEMVKDQVRGCCGQLDIQSDGDHLVIAQNCDFKVGTYDRDGKLIRDFGKRGNPLTGDKADPVGWGSCCNPMNVRCLGSNEILVAESSIGHIKRYSSEGEFLGIVGTAKIGGGCKHVAIARALDRDWYFMMNTTANNIAVLVPLSEAPAETDDERESRLAMQGLGQKLLGSWKFEKRIDKKEQPTDKDIQEQLQSGEFDYGAYLIDKSKFLNLQANGKVSKVEPMVTAPANSETPSKTNSQGGFFSSLARFLGMKSSTTVSGSNAVVKTPEEPTRWQAIKQEQDIIQFALIENEVRGEVVAVRFIDDKTAEFKWYYDGVAGEPLAAARFVKVAGCTDGSCPTTPCDKP